MSELITALFSFINILKTNSVANNGYTKIKKQTVIPYDVNVVVTENNIETPPRGCCINKMCCKKAKGKGRNCYKCCKKKMKIQMKQSTTSLENKPLITVDGNNLPEKPSKNPIVKFFVFLFSILKYLNQYNPFHTLVQLIIRNLEFFASKKSSTKNELRTFMFEKSKSLSNIGEREILFAKSTVTNPIKKLENDLINIWNKKQSHGKIFWKIIKSMKKVCKFVFDS